MLRLIVLCFGLVSSGVTAGYPDGSTGNTVGTGDSSSNSFGYGYSGSFAGGDGSNIPAPVFDFQKFLTSYLDGINKYQQEFIKQGDGVRSYSYASSSPTSNATASSSLTLNGDSGLQAIASQAAQAGAGAATIPGVSAAANPAVGGSNPSTILHGTSGGFGGSSSFSGGGAGYGGGYGGAAVGPSGVGASSNPNAGPNVGGTSGSVPNLFSRFGGDSGAAFASGSIGPGGGQQSAAVYPENPNFPNINTRFAGTGEPTGFRSVFTSSQSHSTNVNGKPQTVQQASTTINDNGKITTYTAKNP